MIENVTSATSSKTADSKLEYEEMFDSHDKHRDIRRHSATTIAQMLQSYVKPDSVIDLGCGMGFFWQPWRNMALKFKVLMAPGLKNLIMKFHTQLMRSRTSTNPIKFKAFRVGRQSGSGRASRAFTIR
jgi:hypothetical protein